MFQNYLKVAFRNLKRNKLYSLINVAGLALGITVFLLISVYVIDESQVNSQLKDLDRQYVIESEWTESGMGLTFTSLAPLGPALKEAYPNLVEGYYRVHGIVSNVSHGEDLFRESVLVGDPDFLEMYGFELVEGNAATALQEPNSVVILEGLAEKIFGKKEVLGEILTVETSQPESNPSGKKDYTISGVMKTPPQNSVTAFGDVDYTVFLPMSNISYYAGRDADKWWGNNAMVGFLKLAEGVSAHQLNEPMAQLVADHAPPQFQEKYNAVLKPLDSYHLYFGDGSRQKTVYTLAMIAAFIMLMAIINFVNITIGKSGSRLREIGVRKVLGGNRIQLIGQFLAESIVLTLIAFVLAVVLTELSLPAFSGLIGKELSTSVLPKAWLYPLLLMTAFGTGLLAGFYPAVVQSGFQAVSSLKGKMKISSRATLLKKGLLGLQFFIAAFLLISAFTIHHQIQFLFDKDLGYNPESVLVASSVPRDWNTEGYEKLQTLKQEFERVPGVEAITLSFEVPDGRTGFQPAFYPFGTPPEEAIPMQTILCDADYQATWELRLKEGDFFHSPEASPISGKVVINESTARAFGWEAPIGKQLFWQGISQPFTVAGVVEDFHFTTLHEPIKPLLLMQLADRPVYRYLSFRLKNEEQAAVVNALEQKWASVFPAAPFVFDFMSNRLEGLYLTETRLKKAVDAATFLGILIVLLGMFGLVMQSLNMRLKEISIRRILGASAQHIIKLFMRDYVWILALANLIAWPLAYSLMQQWLEGFAYSDPQSLGLYLISALIITGLMMLMIAAQSLQAARKNPADNLRNE